MNRNANRARLVGDRSGDCLTDPPGRISRKLVATPPVKFLDASHEAKISLLNQIEKTEAPILILLGDRYDQPQVGFREFVLRLSRLSFTDGNHPLRAFDLQRRDVMLNFDLFEPAPALTNLSREFFLVVILYAFAVELLGIVINPEFEGANLFLNCANRLCKTLARRFFQIKRSDLLSHIKPGSRQLPL